MTNRAYWRIRNWLNWLRERRAMRREISHRELNEPNPSYVFHVHPGEYMTVFDYDGEPMYAQVLDIDRRGNARLLREDDVVIERALH